MFLVFVFVCVSLIWSLCFLLFYFLSLSPKRLHWFHTFASCTIKMYLTSFFLFFSSNVLFLDRSAKVEASCFPLLTVECVWVMEVVLVADDRFSCWLFGLTLMSVVLWCKFVTSTTFSSWNLVNFLMLLLKDWIWLEDAFNFVIGRLFCPTHS